MMGSVMGSMIIIMMMIMMETSDVKGKRIDVGKEGQKLASATSPIGDSPSRI